MKFRVYKALARGVLLESLRRKDLWVVAILGFLIMIASGALGFFGIDGLEIFAKDLAVSVLGLLSTVIAILTSSRLLPDEIKQRTLYPLLSRPISRFDLLIGKLIGAVVVTWIAFLLLATLTAVALASFHIQFEWIMVQYVIAKMMGLVVICAFSLALSTYMTPSAAATMSFIFAFGTSMISRGLTMAYDSSSSGVQHVFKFVDSILPHVSLFDWGGRVANIGWETVPMWVMGFLFAYMLVYSTAMLILSWMKFRKQAV